MSHSIGKYMGKTPELTIRKKGTPHWRVPSKERDEQGFKYMDIHPTKEGFLMRTTEGIDQPGARSVSKETWLDISREEALALARFIIDNVKA